MPDCNNLPCKFWRREKKLQISNNNNNNKKHTYIYQNHYFLIISLFDKKLNCISPSAGAREPGGSEGVRPPLELEIYIVKISKIRKIYFFLSIGPPLGKNRSLAPGYTLPVFAHFFSAHCSYIFENREISPHQNYQWKNFM